MRSLVAATALFGMTLAMGPSAGAETQVKVTRQSLARVDVDGGLVHGLALGDRLRVVDGGDTVAQLEENISVAAEFQPLNSAQMAAIEAKVADYPAEAAFFKEGAAGFDQDDGAPDDQQMGD